MPYSPKELSRELGRLAAQRQSVADRFFAEIEFARALAKLEGPAAAGWDELISRAVERFSRVAENPQENPEDALREAEEILAPIGQVAKQHTIHCVGHGHIDMNWMWSWPETVAVTNDTFTTVLKLMDEFPDFTYTQSQASVYEIARKYNPELFEGIKQRVKEGRWEVVAAHWVEGDKNLASGESLTRHLLYTRRFMKEHFGLEPEDVVIDWEPDTFGHALSIPGIDARGGVRRYYCCRTGAAEKPAVFFWQGLDGSKVLVNREINWYNSAAVPEVTKFLLQFRELTGLKDWMLVYGVGDHGGGPTRRDIRRIIEMNEWPVFPNFRFATTNEYYNLLEAHGDKIPTYDKELNFEFSGCYTSESAIKKNNRYGENACGEAETAAVLAARAIGKQYPAEDLRQAWTDVIFNHFHDILPGSGVPATRAYNQGTFQNIIATTSMVKTQSLRALAGAVDTSFAGTQDTSGVAPDAESMALGGGAGRGTEAGEISVAAFVKDGPRPVVVFNPTTWPRREVVNVTVWDAQTGLNPGKLEDKTFVVRDPSGNVIAAQRVRTGEYWGHHFADLAFPVEVPALGYSSYVIEEGEAPETKKGAWYDVAVEGGWGVNLPGARVTLENEFLRVGFDKDSGGIVEFVDKRTGKDLADPAHPMAMLEYVLERPRGGTAWIIGDTQYREYPLEVTAFEMRSADGWAIDRTGAGPHVAGVSVKVKVKSSNFTVSFAIKAGQPWLDITIAGRWLERGGPEIGTPQLAMRFPSAIQASSALYEIPFGSIERDGMNGREVPSLRWANVTGTLGEGRNGSLGEGGTAGLALLNDSRYGHSYDGKGLRLTLLRSSYDPDPLPEIGDHSVRLALAPHAGDLATAGLTRLGADLNLPLQVVNTDVHEGRFPASSGAVVASDAPNVLVSQVKRAEDDDTVIFRLFETEGKETTARVTVDAGLLGTVAEATEVDFIERPTASNSAAPADGGFTVRLPAHGIASVKVRFE